MSIEELCEKVKLQGESRTHEDRVRLLSKADIFKENMLHGAKEILLNEDNLCLRECKPSNLRKGRKESCHISEEEAQEFARCVNSCVRKIGEDYTNPFKDGELINPAVDVETSRQRLKDKLTHKQVYDDVLISRAKNKGIPVEFDDNGSCKEFLTELCNKVTTDNKHDDKLPDIKGDELL